MIAPKMKIHMSLLPNQGLILLRISILCLIVEVMVLRDLPSPGQFSTGSWRFPFVQVILELLFQTQNSVI